MCGENIWEREVGNMLADIITADMLNGVFEEIVAMLPVIVPVTVGFIAVRKGLSFLFGSLRKA